MIDKMLATLKQVFGFDAFRGQQQAIIETVLHGEDALALMPTGGGKSLCYQLPALLKPGVAVVISPLIALMQDQVQALHQLGIRAAFLNSSQTGEQVRAVLTDLHRQNLDLLYLAPERLNDGMLERLAQVNLALFAIDEAHCVSHWGHDFRADYLKLSVLHQRFPDVPRIALTATADARTRQEIAERLDLTSARHFITGFDRPNIFYRIVPKDKPRQQLLDFIEREHSGEAGIVYCLSRKKTEQTAEWLTRQGIKSMAYHAGLEAEVRQRNQHRFLMEEGWIMAATIAFGMGIDKPNVRFVAHLDLPKSLEGYYQETGRAGRDGLPANAWMAYGLQDVITLKDMLGNSSAPEAHKRRELVKLDTMLGLCEQSGCRRQTILRYFGEDAPDYCGQCDNCLEPVSTWDATEPARQALSCIYRTGQRFGINYLIDVLRGKSNERIQRFGHHLQSTFGIGQALSEGQWRSLFRQLAVRGLVSIDDQGHGGLLLEPLCRPLLRGEVSLYLREDSQKGASRKKRSELAEEDQSLFERLRMLRSELAKVQDIPPYLIFNDATLQEMARLQPETEAGLRQISGVGDSKLKRYGEAFLNILRSAPKKNREKPILTETAEQSFQHFQLGMTPEQIAGQRNLQVSTVLSHLAQGIACGQVSLTDVVALPTAEIADICKVIETQPEPRLKPVFEHFQGRYDYGLLRCVLAALQAGSLSD